MILWNRKVPAPHLDAGVHRPFIANDWFRKHYMYFAYGLMILIYLTAVRTGGFRAGNYYIKILMFPIIYVCHEMLHILTVYGKGDIYLNHSGLYLWLTPDFELTKGRYWIFVSLPLIVLTGATGILSVILDGTLSGYLRYIAWINAVIAGSDIINSVLIAIKPADAVFCRGYYRLNKNRN